MSENPWYSQLREAWKPSHVRLLLIGESAPDDGGDPNNRRFFYSDRLGSDNLFRGVVKAMYGRGSMAKLIGYAQVSTRQQFSDRQVFLLGGS